MKTLCFYGASDIGLSRPTNQDVWVAEPEIGLFALADGIGGRRGGEVAANKAIEVLCQSVRRLAEETNYFKEALDVSVSLRKAIETANSEVYQLGKKTEFLLGMGSTLCCLWCVGELIYYGHVGDSRIYHYREGILTPLTDDHSLFARWMKKKRRELPSPPKNIITKAIGMSGFANPEISCHQPLAGDLFLLCSDGLTDVLKNKDLEEMIRRDHSLEETAQTMILSAKNMGSNDNITVLMVKYE